MAGEMRDWQDDRQIVERRDYVDSPFFEAKFKVQILESRMTPFCHLEIAWSPLFGHLMFIDGEIQISEADDADYHTAMWRAAHRFISVPDLCPRALVVGDGDGGFTRIRTGARSIDVVERDRDVIAAGERYFGADWGKVNLHVTGLDEFKPDGQYDVAMLAIDDGFNGAVEFEADLERVVSWIKPGGKLVAQAGSDLDPKHPAIFDRYREWANTNRFPWARERVYIRCYFCHENFFVVEKK